MHCAGTSPFLARYIEQDFDCGLPTQIGNCARQGLRRNIQFGPLRISHRRSENCDCTSGFRYASTQSAVFPAIKLWAGPVGAKLSELPLCFKVTQSRWKIQLSVLSSLSGGFIHRQMFPRGRWSEGSRRIPSFAITITNGGSAPRRGVTLPAGIDLFCVKSEGRPNGFHFEPNRPWTGNQPARQPLRPELFAIWTPRWCHL